MPRRRCAPTAPISSASSCASACWSTFRKREHRAPRSSARRCRCRSRSAPIGLVRHAARRRRDPRLPRGAGRRHSLHALAPCRSARSRTWRRRSTSRSGSSSMSCRTAASCAALIERAAAAKCSALVLTVDLQVLGQRHGDIKNGMTVPPEMRAQERRRHRDQAGLGAEHRCAASAGPSAISPAT